MPKTLVTVGASLTAAVAARALRRRGYDGAIVLVGQEPHPPYERPPLSKEYLRGDQDRAGVVVLTEQWCADHDVELRLGVAVERIDRAGNAAELADGSRVPADTFLLATGGRPRVIPGVEGERVVYLRTLEDADRLRPHLAPGRHVITVGGGFIGSEVAATARRLGADVTVLEMLDVPLQRALGPELGAVCAAIHTDHGVTLRTGETVESVVESDAGVVVRTRNGLVLEGDVVVVGIGIVPNVEVAERSGVAVDNGVLVDEYCRTDVPGIYAAGDVANHYHPLFRRRLRVEHFDNADKQGVAAARNILGPPTVFDDPHWFWSDQYDYELQYAGYADRWDEIVVRGSLAERDFIAFFLQDRVVRAAFSIQRGDDVLPAKELIATQARTDPAQLRDEDLPLADLVAAAALRAGDGP